MLENYQFENVNVLLSTLCVTLVSAVVYLFLDNKRLTNEHKGDLKLFKNDNYKLNKEFLDLLGRLHISMEEAKLGDTDLAKKIDRMILLLEKMKDDAVN